MSLKIIITTCLMFTACCINILILEKLVNDLPGVANLITFIQFLFTAIEGFIFTSKFGTKRLNIAVKDCAGLVALFFITSICNNYAFNFNVPNTLHIIIKSGSIVANMSLGILLRNRSYSREKFASATFITIGIIMCTTASAKQETVEYDYINWCIGVCLLIVALMISAFMGILQELLYNRCGKHSDEVLYYTHLLPLPLFALLYNDLSRAVKSCNESSPIRFTSIDIPRAWPLIALNVLSQYVCIRSVYTLTSECTSLTVTIALTLRKFASLALSVMFFDNLFTISHWIGSIFVFLGTLLYFDGIKSFKSKLS